MTIKMHTIWFRCKIQIAKNMPYNLPIKVQICFVLPQFLMHTLNCISTVTFDVFFRCSLFRQMETKINRTWMLKGIAFLLLLVTLIHCPRQFIGHRCRIWTRVKIWKNKQKAVHLMPRQLLNHLFMYLLAFLS